MIQLSKEQIENCSKLIADLRKGTYNQGIRRLCSFDKETKQFSFCAMGVCCLVSGMKPTKDNVFDFGDWGASNLCWSSKYIEEKFGFPGDYQNYLAGMNDDGIPFKIIADMIEKHMQNGFQNYRIDNNDTLSKFHEQKSKA
jgi:hypothetical protein